MSLRSRGKINNCRNLVGIQYHISEAGTRLGEATEAELIVVEHPTEALN